MIGDRIRNIRKAKRMTLKELTEYTGLSIGYISQVERNLAEPSIIALRKIAVALDASLYQFVDDNSSDHVYTNKDDRVIMKFRDSPTVYELISPLPTNAFNPSMLGVYFDVKPNEAESEDCLIHTSEELIILLEGEAEIILGTERIILKCGDTLYIKKNVPHKIINTKDLPLRAFCILSPPKVPMQK